MRDPQEQTREEDGSGEGTTSDEIAKSLGSVWQRFSGQRPKSTSVEISQDVVRCVIHEGIPDTVADEDGETPLDPGLLPDSATFRYNATAAIARITRRRVVAFIPKRDKKTEISTQTFILDRPPRRF
jgi:hypothetical protein